MARTQSTSPNHKIWIIFINVCLVNGTNFYIGDSEDEIPCDSKNMWICRGCDHICKVSIIKILLFHWGSTLEMECLVSHEEIKMSLLFNLHYQLFWTLKFTLLLLSSWKRKNKWWKYKVLFFIRKTYNLLREIKSKIWNVIKKEKRKMKKRMKNKRKKK